jgi:predicted RNA binding protein YcfA (HicA-like mRNA interferase family)
VKLPRDLSGRDLAGALEAFGYRITRESGSHLRLTTQLAGEHHLTIPDHNSLRIGTLASILGEVAEHVRLERSEVQRRLFGT